MPAAQKGPKAGGGKASRRSARQAARRRQQNVRRITFAAAIIVVGAGVIVGISLAGGSSPAEPSLAVTVKGSDFKFEPDPALALAGDVNITLENLGSAGHELIVLEEGFRISNPAQFDESRSLGRIPSIPRDAEATVTLPLEPGTYQFVCLIPGHLEAGMESDLIVT